MKVREFIPRSWVSPIRRTISAVRSARMRARIRFRALRLGRRPKIVYALVPPPKLSNIGDQAQVVAIRRWLARHYSGWPVLEVDKDEVLVGQGALRRVVTPLDLIFLHSGGNLGDRGMWSETGRRMMIRNFPANRIISLPQTIFFSDTPVGRQEREKSRSIYAQHRMLTVMGRDRVSGEIAAELFPYAQVLFAPDFVLSLSLEDLGLKHREPEGDQIIACLRRDNESIFTPAERETIGTCLEAPATLMDTTLEVPIPPGRREEVLRRTLEQFLDHRAVITDRFHGVIFAVLCRRPTVVLPTVDHKLTSSVEVFADVDNVVLSKSKDDVPEVLRIASSRSGAMIPEFNSLYFDRLPALLADFEFPTRPPGGMVQR